MSLQLCKILMVVYHSLILDKKHHDVLRMYY